MQLESLSWFPGHMTKTRRMVASEIGSMDAVCEIIDARIPRASRNPDLDELTAGKPRIVVLNRVDQADPKATKQWAAWFRAQGYAVLEVDAKSGAGVKQFAPAVRALLADKLRAYEEKGQVGRVLRVMVLGIPNVGKSTFINKVSGRKTAKAEDRPGVTRDDVMDMEDLASRLMAYLGAHYPDALTERYKIAVEPGEPGWELLEKAGRKRGFLMSGGEVNTERMARILLDEYRAGKLGRFTLELPEENA